MASNEQSQEAIVSTFADDLEAEATRRGEPILVAVIGEMGWPDYGNDDRHERALARRGELLTWDTARPLLAYEYSDGYGAPDCNAVYAWTANWVLYVSQYDGSTRIYSIPRNPIAHLPAMPGG